MITKNLILLTCSSLFILSLPLFETCNAECTPSACGLIPNITTPFRLKGNPNGCGDPRFELVCENDVVSIYLNSQKYHVKAIDYSNFTIRVADVSINNTICSFPAVEYSNPHFHPYLFDAGKNQLVNLVSCQHPLSNSSFFSQATRCEVGKHTYIMVGRRQFTGMDYMCTLESIIATSWDFRVFDNVSLSEIYQSLVYGFELSWFSYVCSSMCKSGCSVMPDGVVACGESHSGLYDNWAAVQNCFRPPEGPSAGYLMIFMLVVAVLFAGVSLPAKIIIIFGASYWFLVNNWWSCDVRRIIVVSFEVRLVVGFLCAMCFLIYKFRRRHLSTYDAIEGFLQSDNKLTPIRYSYSELKKMTRGFREKLGQGGFGCVYKGKLRSGHHVAVKILKTGTTKGQDFINEIATIGRIHHVNVVNLVGYCAQGSKRALVFDFMPNGSLEKYILNRETIVSLDWDTKFKIALGVARGIEYLHRGCAIQILHFDIKPHNILLDDNYIPKISDFGLAKLCSVEKDTVSLTAARGTIGYVAPELINRSLGAVSYKADVYSYGMLLMEIVGLNREYIGNRDDSSKYFPYWIYDSFNQGEEIEIETSEEQNGDDRGESTRSLVRKMTIVALWCIQMSPNDRPSMNRIMQMLEGNVDSIPIPEYRDQSTHGAIDEEESPGTSASDSVSLLHYSKANKIEISIA